MFTNSQTQQERTGKIWNSTDALPSELVIQFQNAFSEEAKERFAAYLANFACDPYNHTFLRQLNILELFLDCITEPNEKLVEFVIGGICNSCAGALYYKCNASNKEEILKPEVADLIKRYAAAGTLSISFSNLAQAFLAKHVH